MLAVKVKTLPQVDDNDRSGTIKGGKATEPSRGVSDRVSLQSLIDAAICRSIYLTV